MKVILKDDVENLGRLGDVKDVAPGYARNYLIPRNLVLVATSRQVARVEHEKRLIEARVEERRTGATAESKKIEATPITLTVKAGEGGRLFGSVTSRDVAEALAAKGFSVERRSLRMDGPLKSLGSHAIEVDLGYGVHATATVNVEAEAGSEPEKAKAAQEDAQEATQEFSGESDTAEAADAAPESPVAEETEEAAPSE